MHHWIETVCLWIATAIETATAGLILAGVGNAIRRGTGFVSGKFDMSEVKHSLGKCLALSLEFLLAADILRTAVAPTWDILGKLAAVAFLRTALTYFLSLELKMQQNDVLDKVS